MMTIFRNTNHLMLWKGECDVMRKGDEVKIRDQDDQPVGMVVFLSQVDITRQDAFQVVILEKYSA